MLVLGKVLPLVAACVAVLAIVPATEAFGAEKLKANRKRHGGRSDL
jgi:hypothetical protein